MGLLEQTFEFQRNITNEAQQKGSIKCVTQLHLYQISVDSLTLEEL